MLLLAPAIAGVTVTRARDVVLMVAAMTAGVFLPYVAELAAGCRRRSTGLYLQIWHLAQRRYGYNGRG